LALSAENRRKAVLLRFVAPFRLTTFGTLPEGQAQGQNVKNKLQK